MNKDAQHLICGGRCTSRTAVAPLERIKILFQVQDYLRKGADASANASAKALPPPKYNGVWASLRTIGVEEGVRGYFRGNGANCARVFPYTAIQFAAFERMKPLLMNEGETTLSPLQKLCGGATAGVVSVIFTYPLDFVRARLTVQGGLSTAQYSGIVDALRGTFKSEGIAGMYRGVSPTILGVAPYVGLNFMVFETLRGVVPVDANGDPNTWYILGCGAVAGACGQTAAYPMDLLRRRFQVSSMGGDAYSSTLGGLRAIVREEGFAGLYKGLWPNFIKVVPSIAIMFTTNELLKRYYVKKE
uniref:Mitochondrial carrier protein n=1 Tax=Globisporangium ultimum (strain ATCC 200006 / CBS 805.95 / DAOM BR144) TaxID=431595 RepID=K3WFZ9_GLOUD